ncbi:MAG: T9SS type A sorting domain-containing protein [Bacteroidetes bacterium]|nr:MAG: T9SS type A sorting domain-containing protein [Bacteroidota bacterium]
MKAKYLLLLFIGLFGWNLEAQIAGRFQAPGIDFSPEKSVQGNTIAMAFPYAAPRHFIAFSLSCTGRSTAGTYEVRYALRDYEQTHWMSEWVELEDDPHMPSSSGERQFNMVFFPPDAWFMELRAGDLKAEVSTEYVFYSPVDYAPADPEPRVHTEAVQDRACPCPLPGYVDRAGWDGPPTQEAGCTPQYTNVTHLFVHHQAGVANPPYGAVVKAIWQQHVYSNGWCDIGYNWVIAPDGTVFEGRAGGNNVVGAHVTGHNVNSMGVCMLGNFQSDQPTPAALESLRRLLAWKSCDSGIDPVAASVHPASGTSLNNISGHRDAGATLCPGDHLYSRLPEIRTLTDALYRDPSGCDGLFPPGNDDCANAVLLFSSDGCMPVEGTTNDATASGVPIPTCNGFTSETALDVWYSFGAIEDHHQVTVKPTGNLPDPLDAVVAVYDGNCNNLQLVACADVPGGAGVQTTVDLPDLVPGHVYYVRVYDYGSVPASDGRFEICVTHGQSVATHAPEASAQIVLFPNPSFGVVTVQLPGTDIRPVTVRVFDLTGRQILKQQDTGPQFRVDLTGHPVGIYLVEVQTVVGAVRKRLLIRQQP